MIAANGRIIEAASALRRPDAIGVDQGLPSALSSASLNRTFLL